jgi:hypothetical protein
LKRENTCESWPLTKIATEQDHDKFVALVDEMNQLLDEKLLQPLQYGGIASSPARQVKLSYLVSPLVSPGILFFVSEDFPVVRLMLGI